MAGPPGLPVWHEVSRSVVYERFGRALAEVVFRLPSGIRETFSIKVESRCVAVVALTPDRRIVLTRQFRPGPARVLYELPGGVAGPGEDPAVAGARELREETGFAGRATLAGECYPDPYSTCVKSCVVVTGASLAGPPTPDPEEFIAVSLVSVAEFRAVLRSGQLTDTDAGYQGLDHLGLL